MELAGKHTVLFIEDGQLPPEQDWAFLECEGVTYLAIKKSCVTERVLEDAWAAYRQRVVGMIPTQRLAPAV